MRILIVYATTEGQTRKICQFCADQLIKLDHSVELLNASDAQDLEVSRFDQVILAGSVHLQKVQDTLITFAQTHGAALSRIPVLYLQVSLSAAGDDASDWAGLQKIADGFCTEIGWTPGRIEQIAGAFRFTQYDFFRSWAMRWIAASHGTKVDPQTDTEFTDWAALTRILQEWCPAAPR